jgi:hypothetical protein
MPFDILLIWPYEIVIYNLVLSLKRRISQTSF